MFKFDYLIYIILFLIAIALFCHYRERISNKIIMTEYYVDATNINTDSVINGQLQKYNITYNDALKGYDAIANSYTNMKTQNNKLEPGSLADPSSYDQNFNTLKNKYDILSGDVAVKRAEIAQNVKRVSDNYDRITGIYNSDVEKNYVRNQINAKQAAKVNAIALLETPEALSKELIKQVSDTSNTNIINSTGVVFNAELDADNSGRYLQTLITPVYNDGLNTAKKTIISMASDSQQMLADKVNSAIGIRKRTLPTDDLSKNNGVVVRIYNKIAPPRELLKEYVIPSINYYAANANDGVFSSSKGTESRIFEFITMVRIPAGVNSVTFNLFTGSSSTLYIGGSTVLSMNGESSGKERSTNSIQVSPGDKLLLKIVTYEGNSSQESYVILKWKKGTETLFEIISSNNYFMPNMRDYGS